MPASSSAKAADQRAYRVASLLFMVSVKQNFHAVYRSSASKWEATYSQSFAGMTDRKERR
jgi:hypothetical protein